MESMENSPLALAIANIVILVLQAILYTRGRNKNEGEKREREGLQRDLVMIRQTVDLAQRAAAEAGSKADHVNRDLYEQLRTKYEAALQDLAEAKTRIRSLEESVSSLSNKLASRDRADRAAEKRGGKVEPDEPSGPTPTTESELDALIRKNGIPLAPSSVPPAPPARNSTFGRVVR